MRGGQDYLFSTHRLGFVVRRGVKHLAGGFASSARFSAGDTGPVARPSLFSVLRYRRYRVVKEKKQKGR